MEPACYIKMIKDGLKYLPEKMSNNLPRVLVAMISIGLQESRFEHRYQVLNGTDAKGPARGFWQFESGGGVKGLMTHKASKEILKSLCDQIGIPFEREAIWKALETNDVLAVVCARLLLYTDPKPLPAVTDTSAMWNMYLWNWRPGAWDRGTLKERNNLQAKWNANHLIAQKEVGKL